MTVGQYQPVAVSTHSFNLDFVVEEFPVEHSGTGYSSTTLVSYLQSPGPDRELLQQPLAGKDILQPTGCAGNLSQF